MPKRTVYKRSKDGRFAIVPGGAKARVAKAKKKKSTARAKRRNSGTTRKRSASENRIAKSIALKNRKDGSGARKKANVNQKAIRRERNSQALKTLRAKGVKIPKGSLEKVAQLKKGQSVRLANGTVIKRSKSGAYTATKPKKKKGK